MHTYSDVGGNSATLNGLIRVVDTTAPVITVLEDNPYTIEAQMTYTDLNVSVFDYADPSVSVSINTDNVIISRIGTYSVTYTAIDKNNREAVPMYRTVIVEDNTAPVISVSEPQIYTIEAMRESYQDLVSSIYDLADPNVSSRLI